jgi:RNA polymerase sigma-70 factor (ECF subfamily)
LTPPPPTMSATAKAKLRLVHDANVDEREPKIEERAPSSSSRALSSHDLAELGDDGLVALTAQGDMRAAELLYRRHSAFAFNLGARIAGSVTDVEDVVHDAFLRAFDNLGTLRNPSAFKSWLGSIVVHAMRSRLRRGRLLRLFGLGRDNDPIDIDCIASEEASPAARAELAQVYALLQTLPPDDRIAWTLRYVEGHDLKAAAELAGCSLATVKRRIRRAQRFVETHFVDTHSVNTHSVNTGSVNTGSVGSTRNSTAPSAAPSAAPPAAAPDGEAAP